MTEPNVNPTPPETPPSPSSNDFSAMVAGLPDDLRPTIEGAKYDSFDALAKSYVEQARMLGVDKATLLKIPTASLADAPDEWGAVHAALGVPKDGAYAELKLEDGQRLPFNDDQLGELNKQLAAAGVTQQGRDAGLSFIASQQAAFEKNLQEAIDAEKAEGAAENQKLWGAKTAAMIAASEHGLDGVEGGAEFTQLLKDAQLHDHPLVTRVLASLAMMRAEDGAPLAGDFVPSSGPALTPSDAQAELNKLMADDKWLERYRNGGPSSPEMKKALELQGIIAGQSAT